MFPMITALQSASICRVALACDGWAGLRRPELIATSLLLHAYLTSNRGRPLVFAHSQEDRVPQVTAGPCGEAHLAHQLGPDPRGWRFGLGLLFKGTVALNERR
jgi:hypothetical protein